MNTAPDWSQEEQKFINARSVKIIDSSHFSIEERCICFDFFTKEGTARNCFTNPGTATKF